MGSPWELETQCSKLPQVPHSCVASPTQVCQHPLLPHPNDQPIQSILCHLNPPSLSCLTTCSLPSFSFPRLSSPLLPDPPSLPSRPPSHPIPTGGLTWRGPAPDASWWRKLVYMTDMPIMAPEWLPQCQQAYEVLNGTYMDCSETVEYYHQEQARLHGVVAKVEKERDDALAKVNTTSGA